MHVRLSSACADLRRRGVRASMSSLTSLGRVSLVFHCAIPSSYSFSGSSQKLSLNRKLSCTCALRTPSVLVSPHDSLNSASETEFVKASGCDSPLTSIVHGYQRSALQSVLSLVVALAMTIGIQGAPSSRDTFEDVPQTFSGKR